jgi:hypothetical protein
VLIAAVRVGTIDARSFDGESVLLQFRGFLAAREADQFLRHRQTQRGWE